VAGESRSRTIAAPLLEVWKLVEDPHHMPRWWPGVIRVEGVAEDRFTQVHVSKRGRTVRMDFYVLESEPPGADNGAVGRRVWEQELVGTPFERVLGESVTEIAVAPDGAGTKVTLEQRQKMRGANRTGSFMVRRATRERLEEALVGLEQIVT
jgi:carbon monoxide dehydrogenase subunit G